jgi:hypothetical protein
MGAAATGGLRGREVQARHAEHPVGMREDVQLFGGGVRVGRSHATSGVMTWPEKLHRLARHFVRDRTDQATEDKKQPALVAVVPDHECTSCPAPAASPVHGSVGSSSPSTTGENGPHRLTNGIRRFNWAIASRSRSGGTSARAATLGFNPSGAVSSLLIPRARSGLK